MKKTVRFAAIILLISFALCLCCFAEETDTRFENKTFDEVIEQFFAEKGVDAQYLSLGYYNTVTGEEHYIDPDTYRMAGSMYKLPLNMYFSDKIYNGEMTWDTDIYGVKYSVVIELSIVNSDNDISEMLQNYIGNYAAYREAISPYMGVDMQTDTQFGRGNYFTARQMIHCLLTLYDGADRYSVIIDGMKRASQDRFFCNRENRFQVAHKYGYIDYNDHLYVNDCAIVYTSQPILITLLADLYTTERWMGELCVLMSEYAEYTYEHTPEIPETPEVQEQTAPAVTPKPPVISTQPEAPDEQAPEEDDNPIEETVSLVSKEISRIARAMRSGKYLVAIPILASLLVIGIAALFTNRKY